MPILSVSAYRTRTTVSMNSLMGGESVADRRGCRRISSRREKSTFVVPRAGFVRGISLSNKFTSKRDSSLRLLAAGELGMTKAGCSAIQPREELFPTPSRRALFEERREAFPEVLGRADLRALPNCQIQFAIDFWSGKLTEQLLRDVQTHGARCNERRGEVLRSFYQRFLRRNLSDQANPKCLGSINRLSCEE